MPLPIGFEDGESTGLGQGRGQIALETEFDIFFAAELSSSLIGFPTLSVSC